MSLSTKARAKLRKQAEERGLYRPDEEHDSCGVGFVASIKGERSHSIIDSALQVLANMEHRGACGCDEMTSDGAGILFQVPYAFFIEESDRLGFELPRPGQYGVAMLFMPQETERRMLCEQIVEQVVRREKLELIAWRDVPTRPETAGWLARESMPVIRQFFVKGTEGVEDEKALERKLYVLRKRIEQTADQQGVGSGDGLFVCSLSSRTIVYKGLLLPEQFPRFYDDLRDPGVASALAIVHSRFSTNTFPSWERSHPYRMMAHNGEINTLRGNVNWMRAREKALESPLFGQDLKKLMPIIDENGSDSQMFDNALEFLVQTGRELPHAMMMMIPEAWQKHETMEPEERDFYQYHACMMEPWDGPASVAFTDGALIGACLDRNGLRPSRYYVTHDGVVVMASEAGVLPIEPENVAFKNRLQPGRMFLVDTKAGRIVDDRELKQRMAERKPYGSWLRENLMTLEDLEEPRSGSVIPPDISRTSLLRQQQVHGYTMEDIDVLIGPMANAGQEPIGSMGNDTPLAVLSDRPQLLFNYFKQLFAQVTNPPIDPIREELVMSLSTYLGAQRNLFEETPRHCRQLELEQPILTNEELNKLRALQDAPGPLRSATLSATFPVDKGGEGLARAIDRVCREASDAISSGVSIIILSDRSHNAKMAPIPSLLAVAAVHHHLVREGSRTRCGLVVESGEPREVFHFCLLMGYGASAVNPYLAYEIIEQLIERDLVKVPRDKAIANYIKAAGKGLLKVMSKMGISTMQSYQGAQIFEAIGLKKDFVDRYFTWTPTRIEGVGLDVVAEETRRRHHLGWRVKMHLFDPLDPGGLYKWRRRGERHMLNPETIPAMQHACRSGSYKQWKEFSRLVAEENRRFFTIRGLLDFRAAKHSIPIEEVEPASEIVKRFKTGAMSFGSISKEAHENLAIAMNRIGGRSNTGEGGEDPDRFTPDPNGDSRRSAIKQVASGRFGVTSHYLVNSDELQIKMAQGAKPGEGGQLPGHKVNENIAKLRFSTPGVGLISPPPHHDIYSIEDLAQLIHDLKNANIHGRVSVKLVSEVGVGTVAAGVAKAKADLVLISGDSGGTGASPLNSIRHAGLPWELGLAETHQVLVVNDLRGRIRVETDGMLRTGRDVAIAAMLGAEEFGFASAALVASGCIMMRVCHLNTCPVGIATQDPKLREKFAGKPEHVVNMMMFIAEELREIMAEQGFRTVDEMVGRSDRLMRATDIDHWKAKDIDLSTILYKPEADGAIPTHCVTEQDHGIEGKLDLTLLEQARPALEFRTPVAIESPIRNLDRTACTILSSEVSRKHGSEGLPEGTIKLNFKGTGGQSFGAFLASGLDVRLEGDANDYFCKGMSGGRVAVYPPANSSFVPEENIIVGNVSLYGATNGEVYVRGRAGERFCVRNSGATAVVEGVGDHGCEYMTRGTVLVLGPTGRNFGAGMSGGVAYIYDVENNFRLRCNMDGIELEGVSGADATLVRGLIERHVQYTGSAYAKGILDAFDTEQDRFVKVMPIEYKRALGEQNARHEVPALSMSI